MIKDIMKDPLFLAQKSTDATKADQQVVVDLLDTLRANLNHCVGMAANMIGTLTIATICLLSYALQQSWLLDVALIYTMISFLAVVVLTRIFIRRYKSRAKEQEKG